jgi:hypothetical protein
MKKLYDRILKIIDELLIPNETSKSLTHFSRIISYEKESLSLSSSEHKLYDQIVAKLIRHGDWDKKFSEKYIQKKLNSVLVPASKANAKERAEMVEKMLEDLSNYDIEHEVFLPIRGIKLRGQPLHLGNVIFIEQNERDVDELLDRVNNSIEKTTSADDVKAILRTKMEKEVREAFLGSASVNYKVVADPHRAIERAIEECNIGLNLLRFSTPFIMHNPDKVGFGLIGEHASGTELSLVFAQDGSLNTSEERAGRYISFDANSQNRQRLDKLGVMKLSEMIKLGDKALNDMQRKMLSAVHWCARSQMQALPKMRLLCLITAIECVLNPRNERPLSAGISEGVAFLLTKNPKERKELRNFIRKLYDSRSSVSHGGHPEVLESELDSLSIIVGNVVFRLLKDFHNYKNQKQLLDWIDDCRLS